MPDPHCSVVVCVMLVPPHALTVPTPEGLVEEVFPDVNMWLKNVQIMDRLHRSGSRLNPVSRKAFNCSLN